MSIGCRDLRVEQDGKGALELGPVIAATALDLEDLGDVASYPGRSAFYNLR